MSPGTEDDLLLAVTREPTVYGVPLRMGLASAFAVLFAFDLTIRYDVFWRLGICAALAVTLYYGMALLTSWEHKWPRILASWAKLRGPSIWSRHTRRWGGVTFRPWPVAIRHDIDEMRDYAG